MIGQGRGARIGGALVAITFCLVMYAEPVLAAKHTIKTSVSAPMPQLVQKDGRYALMVDGAPFFVLGGQANNSSNYPAALPKVWAAIADLHANTLAMPVAWEQTEPTEGHFDFSFVDELVKQAREHDVRLDILWFGAWKNSNANYTPQWVKTDNQRFPRLFKKDGSESYALSPLYDATREADKKAYVALLNHLKAIDGDRHTVIMMQIENEVGVYGSARDYSPRGDALLSEQVPDAILAKMHKPHGSWLQVFGDDADEFSHAYAMARYAEDLAAAGKAAYPLPTYMNDSLKDPLNPKQPVETMDAGGPSYDVLDIYKATAPHVDLLAPDLYSPGSKSYEATLDLYHRPDNALFIGESGNTALYARYLFTALGHQAIGFDPFGFDYTGYSNYPLGAKDWGPDQVKPFGALYQLFEPMQRQWAALSFAGQVWGVSEPDDHASQTIDLGQWKATVSYRQWQFGMPQWDPEHKNGYPEGSEVPSGGVAIAQLADNTYLVTGVHARVSFDLSRDDGKHVLQTVSVDEGHYDAKGQWVFDRRWNGDETDYGLNFTGDPVVLKVTLGTYVKNDRSAMK